MPGACEACRRNYIESENSVPPCEKDQDRICGITKSPIDDEQYPMELLEPARLVVGMWDDIISMSQHEPVESRKQRGNQTEVITKYLPTLEKADFYFSLHQWPLLGYDKYEIFYLINLFHRQYTGVILSG